MSIGAPICRLPKLTPGLPQPCIAIISTIERAHCAPVEVRQAPPKPALGSHWSPLGQSVSSVLGTSSAEEQPRMPAPKLTAREMEVLRLTGAPRLAVSGPRVYVAWEEARHGHPSAHTRPPRPDRKP